MTVWSVLATSSSAQLEPWYSSLHLRFSLGLLQWKSQLRLSFFPALNYHRYILGFHLDCSSEFLTIACSQLLRTSLGLLQWIPSDHPPVPNYLGFHSDCSSEYLLIIDCNFLLLRFSLGLLQWILPDCRPPVVFSYIVQRQSLLWVSVFLFIISITS